MSSPFGTKRVAAQRRGDVVAPRLWQSRCARVRFAPPFVPKGANVGELPYASWLLSDAAEDFAAASRASAAAIMAW